MNNSTPDIDNENKYKILVNRLAIYSLILPVVGYSLARFLPIRGEIVFLLFFTGIGLGIATITKYKHCSKLVILGMSIWILFLAFVLTHDIPAHVRNIAMIREMGNQVQCTAQLNSLGYSIFCYQDEFNGKNPSDLKPFAKDFSDWLICPSTNDKHDDISYQYRGADLDKNAPDMMILAYDKRINHKEKRNVLFVDSSKENRYTTKCLTEEEFLKAVDKDNELRKRLESPEKDAAGNIINRMIPKN